MYRIVLIDIIALGETQWDVSTTQGTRRIIDQKRVLEDRLDGAIPYERYDLYRSV